MARAVSGEGGPAYRSLRSQYSSHCRRRRGLTLWAAAFSHSKYPAHSCSLRFDAVSDSGGRRCCEGRLS
eukprot:3540671-Pleurochrysis_carterae.AAC.1